MEDFDNLTEKAQKKPHPCKNRKDGPPDFKGKEFRNSAGYGACMTSVANSRNYEPQWCRNTDIDRT